MIRDLVQSVATNVIGIPIGLAAGILTARYLGPHDRGLLALFIMLPVTARVFCMMGLDTASIYMHRKQKVPFGVVFANCMWFGAIIGTVAAIVLWFARGWLPGGLGDSGLLLALSLIMVPAEMLNHYLGPLARAVDKFREANLRGLLHKIMNLVSVVIIFMVFHGGLMPYLVCTILIQAAIIAWLCWDLHGHAKGSFAPDFGVLRGMMTFGSKSYATVIAWHAHARADLYLIAAYLNAPDVAFYSIASGLAERLLMATDIMAMVLFPRLASVTEKEAAALTARASRNNIMLALCLVVPLCVFARPLLVTLYGPAYLPALGPMYILIAGIIMVAMGRVLMQFLTRLNVHQHNAYIGGVSAGINIALNMLLIPRYGIMGAAVSSVCTYTIQGVWALFLFRRFSGLPLRSALVVSKEDLRYLRTIPLRMRAPSVAAAGTR
jgi:O-antigen/teichoic acid export membrane protein